MAEAPACRICFDTADSASNPLLRPCRCRGSMRYVHVECLDTWRNTSTNPQSFFRCDTCHFEYRFGSRVGDYQIWSRLGGKHAGTTMQCMADGRLPFHNLSRWLCRQVLLLFLLMVGGAVVLNFNHLVAGATTTGLGSLMGWATAAGGGLGGKEHALAAGRSDAAAG